MNLKNLFVPNWYKCRRNLYLVLIALLVFGTWMVQPARADLTNVKDTLSDSRPSTLSNHTIQFTLSAANIIQTSDTIVVTFPVGFSIGSVDYTDIDLSGSSSGEKTLASAPTASDWGAVFSGQVLTFTAPTGAGPFSAASETLTIEIGTHATADATGDQQITNPSTPGSYTFDIAANGDSPETGALVVAVIAGVTVSATIAEALTFTIAGISNTACTLGNGSATAVTTTATAVPFGSMNANTFKKGCQLLTVNTNAGDGYTMTSQENDQMTNAGSQTIPDTTCDSGTCTESTGGAWTTASANHGLGHTCFGLNCVAGYSSGANYRQFASIADTETAQTIMSSSTPVTNATSTVVYQLSVSGSQSSGDYTNTVVYITTAQFD